MRPAARWVVIFGVLCLPAAAFAAAGDSASSDSALKISLVAINSWIASEIPFIKRRLDALERR